jgi:hypothetical protein
MYALRGHKPSLCNIKNGRSIETVVVGSWAYTHSMKDLEEARSTGTTGMLLLWTTEDDKLRPISS